MKQGKFDASRRSAREPSAQEPDRKETRRRRDWLLILIPVFVIAVAAAILLAGLDRQAREDAAEPIGMTKEDTLEYYRGLARIIESGEMILTLNPEDHSSDEAPIILTVSAAQSQARVDLAGLEADLEAGVGKISRQRYLPDPRSYVSLNKAALRELAEQTAAQNSQTFLESFAVKSTRQTGDGQVDLLTVNPGRRGRELSAALIYDKLLEAYLSGDLAPSLRFSSRKPQPLDAAAICAQYTKAPVNAMLNEKKFTIIKEVPGYGFTQEELEALLDQAEEGRGYVLQFHSLAPEITSEDVEAALYADVLGEAHTPHSWVDDRTVNLILACAEIDGTVLMPGESFSFNEVVGERTAAKGYREATAYVGGASVPEIGGGVCQVASSIYYAVLQADLETLERHAHTYLVTYVPQGMDAAIYWGTLDYKFRNNSPYPIKIDASVSDGDVHIILRGTEWKNYSVKLSSKVLEETPWETVEQYVYDGSYKAGETIVTPYTGYRIATYRTVIDAAGNEVETTPIATSRYSKRDKVVAVLPPPPPLPTAPTAAEPTEGNG